MISKKIPAIVTSVVLSSLAITGCANVSAGSESGASVVTKESEASSDHVVGTEETVTTEEEAESKLVEETVVPDKESDVDAEITDKADDHYLEYLKGNETDADGEHIYEYDDEAEAEYTIFDMNNDGQNELLVRIYGYFIPDIIEYKDGKITHLFVDNVGSAGITFINSENQYVGGDTTHVGRDLYWISEVDDQKNAHTVLFFGMEHEEYDESKPQSFYKLENPPVDYTYEDLEKITETEYESLLKEYTRDNEEILWKKIKDITNDNSSKTDDGNSEK